MRRQRPACRKYQSLSMYNKRYFGQKGDSTTGGGKHTSHCREISTLSQKLAVSHTRPLGAQCSAGLQDRIPVRAVSEVTPQSGGDVTLRAEPHNRRGSKAAIQRSSSGASSDGSRSRFLLEPIPSPQEGRRHEASDKLKMPQRVCCPSTLQDGGTTHSQGLAQKVRLDDQAGSEGCVLHDPHPQLEQTSSTLLRAEPSLPVYMSAIRPVLCSLGLYQDPEASTDPAQRVGSEASGVHRRHSRHGGDGREVQRPHGGSALFTRKPGLYDTPREENYHANPGNRVPRHGSGFPDHGAKTIWAKDKEAETRGGKDQGSSSHAHRAGRITPPGQVQFGFSSYPASSSVLQSLTERPNSSTGGEQTTVRCSLPPFTSSLRGIKLVARTADTLERQVSHNETARHSDRVRRLPQRLGSVSSRVPDRGPLVQGGENPSHKLSRAVSSDSGSENLPEGSDQQTSITAFGQPNSSGLCKQPGRDSLHPGDEAGKRIVDVVSRERHSVDSTASTWEGERYSRHGVKSDERSLGLDAESVNISTDNASVLLPRGRSFCNKTDLPTASFLQLEARSPSRRDGCLPPGLDASERLRQPPMEPDREGLGESGGARSGCRPNSASVAITALVPQTSGATGIIPPENRPSSGGSNGGRAAASSGTTSGRVAYLRQHYASKKLSGEAADLLLSSWRQKSSQSYDSLCKKWIGWCTERQANPVSGPIEDVVNFLAHLFHEGYQYRSLNAYRSAIASMHTPVDGSSIGQHPLVSRLLKGAFQTRPPLPRYQGIWDVSIVLHHIGSHCLDHSLTLKQLSLRTVMLLALTRPSRSADLAKLSLKGHRNTPEGALFIPTALAKQSRPGRDIKEFFFPKFTGNEHLCPVRSLNLYIERTRELRGDNEQLFISFIKPHHPVSSPTIARWLKLIMESAGIDTSIFKAHSVRSASTSAAAMQGVTTEDILNAADWSTESSFQRFYHKPVRNTVFAKTVLTATNNTIDM